MTVKTRTTSIYLAYSRSDPAFAAEISNSLAAEGFMIRGEVHGALDYELAVQLREAIKESDVLVVLATPTLVHSSWLTFEVGIAIAWAKPTYLVTKDVQDESLPPHLRRFPKFKSGDLDKLAAKIHRHFPS